MKRNAKVWVTADGAGGFFRRAREHARKLDRGEPIAPEITVTFEDVRDMLRVLSGERGRLLRGGRERAGRLDRGEPIAPEITVTFEDVRDMLRVLSAERVRLLRVAREKAVPVSDLANGLQRDTRAVSRDVDLLESFGLLRTRYEIGRAA